MPATHTEKCWALSTHALTDRLAGKMEMKADRKLTYACNTREDASRTHTHIHACHTPTQQHCVPAFLPYFPWSSRMASGTRGFLYMMLLQSAPFLFGSHFPSPDVPPRQHDHGAPDKRHIHVERWQQDGSVAAWSVLSYIAFSSLCPALFCLLLRFDLFLLQSHFWTCSFSPLCSPSRHAGIQILLEEGQISAVWLPVDVKGHPTDSLTMAASTNRDITVYFIC